MANEQQGWNWNKGCVGVHHDEPRCAPDDPDICENCRENYEEAEHGT